VARVREGVLLDDAESAGQFVADPYVMRAHVKSVLCVPIEHQGKLSGILYLENSLSSGVFTPSRLEVLRLLSSQIAVSMENARLYAQERELARLQEEFRLAAKIQKELLPATSPSIHGYEIFGTNAPAQTVGGDYFDFVRLDDQHLVMCIADVSGKGLPASLLMANLQASLRGQAKLTLSPAECLSRVNRLLFDSTAAEKYATVFYGILDLHSHRFRYSNGGHETPFLITAAGGCTALVSGGIPLGMLESFPFEEGEILLAPGDLLVMYSDGITEAMNASQVQFGRERLVEFLREQHDRPVKELSTAIVESVRRHEQGSVQSDDITLVAARRIDRSHPA
jgi:sigma-B regulation protein RsbU (phosphoserine phosphatase)